MCGYVWSHMIQTQFGTIMSQEITGKWSLVSLQEQMMDRHLYFRDGESEVQYLYSSHEPAWLQSQGRKAGSGGSSLLPGGVSKRILSQYAPRG